MKKETKTRRENDSSEEKKIGGVITTKLVISHLKRRNKMSTKKIQANQRGHKISRAVFTALALGFTMISVYSQFKFYIILFNTGLAALISGVLEVTRVAALFKLLYTKTGKLAAKLTIMAYVITAIVSAWGAINSFTATVIQKSNEAGHENTAKIHCIKTAYSKQIDQKLAVIDEEIVRLQTATAKYPNSKYWQNRMSQQVTARHAIVTQRENFLNEQPKGRDIERWIQANSAKVGLKIERPSRDSQELKSVTQALQELWKIEKGTAQKAIGVVVTFAVEAGILLLAFLGVADRKSNGMTVMAETSTDGVTVTEGVTQQPDSEQVAKFIEANHAHFKETGNLLPLSRLTASLRPVRKYFETLSHEDLQEIFEA